MGMKASSGFFTGTKGHSIGDSLKKALADKSTASVWKYIKPTAENYPGTAIPRSFNIETKAGTMWTHGNATEHMYEALSSSKLYPEIKNSNPKLYSQFILYDYHRSLNKAVKSGIKYDTKITKGNWEFIFSKPRKKGDNPVVKHAKFSGLK